MKQGGSDCGRVPCFMCLLVLRLGRKSPRNLLAFSCLCVLVLPGYLSHARSFVMTRISKSSYAFQRKESDAVAIG